MSVGKAIRMALAAILNVARPISYNGRSKKRIKRRYVPQRHFSSIGVTSKKQRKTPTEKMRIQLMKKQSIRTKLL